MKTRILMIEHSFANAASQRRILSQLLQIKVSVIRADDQKEVGRLIRRMRPALCLSGSTHDTLLRTLRDPKINRENLEVVIVVRKGNRWSQSPQEGLYRDRWLAQRADLAKSA